MGDGPFLKTPFGPVYGTDGYGRPLVPHTQFVPHDVAAASGTPVRLPDPIPLTSPVAQWQPEPQTQPAPPSPGPSTFPDHQKTQHETRRGQFAGQVFASLVAHAGGNASEQNLARMAQLSVRAADLLLVELEKKQ